MGHIRAAHGSSLLGYDVRISGLRNDGAGLGTNEYGGLFRSIRVYPRYSKGKQK